MSRMNRMEKISSKISGDLEATHSSAMKVITIRSTDKLITREAFEARCNPLGRSAATYRTISSISRMGKLMFISIAMHY